MSLEKKSAPLLPWNQFLLRLLYSISMGLLAIAIALSVGMMGYHHYAQLSWDDAFVNASMILSGMGPVSPLTSPAAQLFAGCYALFSGLAFITIIGLMFTPVLHRLYHKFHLD